MALTVVVVGAGLAGLAAAWELRRAAADVIVLESGRRAGGVTVTERRDGFVVEGGPDGFLAAEPELQDLAGELGIGDRVVDQRATGSMLWTGGDLVPLPAGRAAELLGIQGYSGRELDVGFRSFAGGMAELVEALATRLGTALRVDQGVTAITPASEGWQLAVTGGSTQIAAAVILAVPAWVAARWLTALGVGAGRDLDHVAYHPRIAVSLAYRMEAIPGPLQGAGFVAAPESGAAVSACTYAWLKYPFRAPRDHALLRAFVGPGDGDPGARAHAALVTILGLRSAPLWTRAFDWPQGVARYPPGHAERVAALRTRLGGLAPLALCGAAVDGAGVSACVRSGRAAARALLTRLGPTTPR
ncbi:MAG TPA: FAD-dependent oxidoreductase [Gemmatimonadales bacterium]|nr:FAD-dependent oxidoreductase [Gemmatimonadales bacterium]